MDDTQNIFFIYVCIAYVGQLTYLCVCTGKHAQIYTYIYTNLIFSYIFIYIMPQAPAYISHPGYKYYKIHLYSLQKKSYY